MKNRKLANAILAAAIPLTVLISYSLAKLGEPQSEWIWCDILGAIECEENS